MSRTLEHTDLRRCWNERVFVIPKLASYSKLVPSGLCSKERYFRRFFQNPSIASPHLALLTILLLIRMSLPMRKRKKEVIFACALIGSVQTMTLLYWTHQTWVPENIWTVNTAKGFSCRINGVILSQCAPGKDHKSQAKQVMSCSPRVFSCCACCRSIELQFSIGGWSNLRRADEYPFDRIICHLKHEAFVFEQTWLPISDCNYVPIIITLDPSSFSLLYLHHLHFLHLLIHLFLYSSFSISCSLCIAPCWQSS